MNTFPAELDSLLTVVAAVCDAEGVLLEGNTGFGRLLPPDFANPTGRRVGRFFIQPSFAALLAQLDSGDYRGLITIGEYAGKTRTVLGHVWRSSFGIQVLAEFDIVELERLTDALLDLNRTGATTQHTLVRDNVALRHREVQIVEASLTDPLTGVGNRRKLDQALATEISRARRTGGTLSIAMADIDHFKEVNDRYGHGAGDTVLERFGAILIRVSRTTDIVARFGGEEFVVLMPHTNLDQAAAKAERLRIALAQEILEPLGQPVTASFGVAELIDGESAQALLSRVDKAMYEAKTSGRNRVAVDH